MTTGSDVQDFRVFRSFPSGGDLIGTYFSRVWSGGDSVPYPPLDPSVSLEHPYSMTLISKHNPQGTWWDKNSFVQPFDGGFEGSFGSPSFEDVWTSNDDLDLLGKLREQVAGSSLNVAVSLAEGNQTLKLIANAATALAGAYRNAKRGNLKAAARSLAQYEKSRGRKGLNNLSANWLQYQYGVKPLLNDVFNAAQTLAKVLNVPMRQTMTVSKKRAGTVRSSSPSNYSITGSGFRATKIKAIISEVDLPGLLGLTDPGSVIWEKLPYSFVADWFIPVGAYLQARSAASNIRGTFVTTSVTKWNASSPLSVRPSLELTGFDSYRIRGVSVDRSVSSVLTVPLPSVKPLAKIATISHCLNALALLVSATR